MIRALAVPNVNSHRKSSKSSLSEVTGDAEAVVAAGATKISLAEDGGEWSLVFMPSGSAVCIVSETASGGMLFALLGATTLRGNSFAVAFFTTTCARRGCEQRRHVDRKKKRGLKWEQASIFDGAPMGICQTKVNRCGLVVEEK